MHFNTESLQIMLKGLALGFSIAAPVGPIGILCIRRTLEHGFRSGMVSGLGAASADAFYGTIAAAGLTLIADFLAEQKIRLGNLGGFGAQTAASFRFSAFLLVLGVFCGSALWWLTLATLVNFLRQRLDQKVIFYINKAAALTIVGFGVYLIAGQFGWNPFG